jgi:hypothetical protein
MSKPDDIPQDIWDAASAVVGPPDGLGYAKVFTDRVARAIAAERDGCEKIAWMTGATSTDAFVGNAGRVVADAIHRGRQDQTGDEK